jgi:SAM-dependent methyltransferase
VRLDWWNRLLFPLAIRTASKNSLTVRGKFAKPGLPVFWPCNVMTTAPTENQHLIEIRKNQEAWQTKTVLHQAYAVLYRLICAQLSPVEGSTVELGSGIGALKEFLPNCVTTDIFPNPWLDRVENAYGLSFPNTSLSNVILFDVFHHLQWPGSAFEEFARVVRPHGRVIMMEPGFGLLGKFVYSHFHHEPLGFGQPISWDRSAADGGSAGAYYAAQANAWRLFRLGEGAGRLPEWKTVLVKPLAALSYVASGGFSRRSLYPSFLFPFVRGLDLIADFLPSLFATRLLVVLERR